MAQKTIISTYSLNDEERRWIQTFGPHISVDSILLVAGSINLLISHGDARAIVSTIHAGSDHPDFVKINYSELGWGSVIEQAKKKNRRQN